jgi:Flp pilus assembly protein TadG
MIGRSFRASRMRGVATVEAAIALPVLLALMLASVELTRGFVQYMVLTDAVRNGARYVAAKALFGTTQTVDISTALRDETRNLVVYGNVAGTGSAALQGFLPSTVAVTDAGNSNVQVTAVYAYQPLFGSQLPKFGTGPSKTMAFNMSISVTMRAL